MVTTREFICVAAWHMLEHPELRARYLAGGEEERYAILHEILRLEPVAGHLHRRATADLALEHNGTTYTIPAGALINLHINATNTDMDVVGEQPELRGDTVEQLDAYYEVCFRAAELAREAGVDEVFLEALTKGLVENRATTVAMIDGMGAPPQEGDVFVHGTNLTAMFRGTPAGLGTEKTPVTH